MENELENSLRGPSLETLEKLEDFLQTRIMGQEKILTPLCQCLKYGSFNLNTPGRPRGTLFLLGPTGVGKTESIRSAVEFLYGSDRNFLRLDMSEFSRQAGEEALTNLIGTPRQIAERIVALKAVGVDLILSGFLHFQEEVAYFGEHVLPLVRELEQAQAVTQAA